MSFFKKASSVLCFLTTLILSSFVFAQVPWPQYVMELRQQAISEGVRSEIFDEAFQNVKAPSPKVLHLDRTQPEKRLTFLKYRDTRADAYRIRIGRSELKRHRSVLDEIGQTYGVSPCFIVSLWGMETSYGRFMGNFPVIQSLATLSYDNRRSAYFRKELMQALHILNDGHVDLAHFKGEWAGASGHPQFLPTSWKLYAVDHDQSGKRDIWTNLDDAFASIANYLAKNGWKSNEPWAIPVSIPAQINETEMNLKTSKTVGEWMQLGVHPLDGELPASDLMASLINPLGGPAFLVFNNFKVIMKWNHSTYYAGTIGYMAEQICQKKL